MLKVVSRFVLEVLPYLLSAVIAAIVAAAGFFNFTSRAWRGLGGKMGAAATRLVAKIRGS